MLSIVECFVPFIMGDVTFADKIVEMADQSLKKET